LTAEWRSTIAGRKWTHALIKPEASQVLLEASEQLQRLGDVVTVDIGLVTGANNYFLLNQDKVLETGLDETDLRRVVARGHQLPGFELTTDEWEDQRRRGDVVWLFAPATAEDTAAEYIRQGEADQVNTSYKCQVRKPWWRVKLTTPPDLILSYMSNHAPRL